MRGARSAALLQGSLGWFCWHRHGLASDQIESSLFVKQFFGHSPPATSTHDAGEAWSS